MASPPPSVDPPPLEVLPWLKTLPLAPEYHPTLAEFQDPIAYIHKIEKAASQYGICKIVPPVPPAAKKTAIANLNRSFAALPQNLGSGCGGSKKGAPTFTTRQQQIGFCPRRPRPVQKPVWQSGEQYTLQQFEAKAKQFERTHVKRNVAGGGGSARKGGGGGSGGGGPVSPLEVETLFWKACADKPFSVEYANDMPGSGFGPLPAGKKWREGEAATVGDTAWNMRGVSRAKGSLLKFMKEEIPGVTSPMVYVAMMFSWFAWHVEDHELHSLNYLHMGAGKMWYGVPRDAELAFEEVVRVHGYGGEVNSLVTFAILCEKTTVMSPEVLIAAGIPCCRLVQNAGEFVVTFPGSYHSGFSLGFNCGEAANIATPEWLRVAKEAAIRRASINYPPMVSHYQLLYELALSLCSRTPTNNSSEPRSSRLKDKMKSEGELMIKELFVESVMQNNGMLHVLLDKGSSCVVLPHNTFDISLASNSRVRSQIKIRPRLSLGLCSEEEAVKASRSLLPDDVTLEGNGSLKHLNGFSVKRKFFSAFEPEKIPSQECSKTETFNSYTSSADPHSIDPKKEGTLESDGLLDQGLLSCVTCGILSFACVAVVQPTDAAARYLMSADCSSFSDLYVGCGGTHDVGTSGNAKGNCNLHASTGSKPGQSVAFVPDVELKKKCSSALDLLASAYGDSSDSEEVLPSEMPGCADQNDSNIKSTSSPGQYSGYSHGTVLSPDAHCSRAGSKEELFFPMVATDGGSESHPSLCFTSGKDGHPENLECGAVSSDLCQKSGVNDAGMCQQKSAASMGDLSENMEMMEKNELDNAGDLTLPAFLLNSLRSSVPTEDNFGDLDTISFPSKIANIDQSHGQMKKPGSDTSHNSANSWPTPTGDTTAVTQLGNFNSSVSFIQKSDKDSSRMHIFCLEHALEVEKQLCQIGGAHLMLLCHPDYPKIENEAKALADELGVNYSWREIHFQESNKEDQQRIRSALEDEEAVPVNSDWAVKLGINLYYSANLSKSPLYSKQLPYNAVIYKAFSRNSSGGSPGELKVYGKREGRQKKIVVAGKWCGKVWMTNQVHPYLAHKNDTHEDEDAEKIDSEASDKKPDIETHDTNSQRQVMPPKRKRSSGITRAGRESGKKAKKSLGRSSAKRTGCTEVEDATVSMKGLDENSPVQCGRILRSSMTKPSQSRIQNPKENSNERSRSNFKDDADEGRPSTRLRTRPSASERIKAKPDVQKQVKKAKKQPGNSVDMNVEDGEYPCNVEGCSMTFNSKHDLVLHKRNICPVRDCGKKFFSHKYLVHHRRVHMDDRPLKCPWKGCKMTFKWAWARTEHIRVHTGARPYVCKEPGCGQTFRFVSDFSRHKRKTGHVSRKGRG